MTPLRQRMIDDMKLRNRSPRTIETYVWSVAHSAKFHGRSPDHVLRKLVGETKSPLNAIAHFGRTAT
jgi:hypothetical protein